MSELLSSMAGSVYKVLVKPGDRLESGDEVAILESMKMEIPITMESTATVKELKVSVGDFVNEGDVILVLE
jgi:acetyl-CoA carboxylase biotin carboxyl carrier protein